MKTKLISEQTCEITSHCMPRDDSEQSPHLSCQIRVFCLYRSTLKVPMSKDSDQTAQMQRLIWVYSVCTCGFVGFFCALAEIKIRAFEDNNISVAKFINFLKLWLIVKWQCHSMLFRNVTVWNEPQHDKTNKMTCAPSKDSDQCGHLPSLISLVVCFIGC